VLGGCNLLAGIEEPKHAPVCGDGSIGADEQCDDGNTEKGDGCDAHCQLEQGFACSGQPSHCESHCGDGVLASDEPCDDGNADAGDGCSDGCQVEPGFVCAGSPSVCEARCGNGLTDPGEGCDDGNHDGGDGCSAKCEVELGFGCSGAPSICAPICGDGLQRGDEACDDGNLDAGDGCSTHCKIEHGFGCAGVPAVCHSTCGDGVVASDEPCDDGNAAAGDGCGPTCNIEHGFSCAGEPSKCADTCGDGVIAAGEQCDDGNLANGDGCDAACQVETGFDCAGEPSLCAPICGDGQVMQGEQCDDGNLVAGDGCSPTCHVEQGFGCTGQPSKCVGICGDGLVVKGEQCDDGNLVAGDCCSAGCTLEVGCQLEVERNDSTADADLRASDPQPVKLTGSGRIKGSVGLPHVAPFTGVDGYDYFAVSLSPASSVLRIETFDGTGRDCVGIDTQITLAQAAPFVPLYTDLDGGIGACSAIVANAVSGPYYLRISGIGAVPAYLLELKIQSFLGAEVEPNNTMGTATTFNGSDGYMSGSHQVVTDADFFAVTVPSGGGSLRAEILEGAATACSSMATALTLFDGSGAQLVDVAGGGRDGCSRIDGTGSVPLHAAAHALAPGKYYLRVRSSTATLPQAAFEYRLSVVVR
jgi:cysteine-rich repeat protein